MRIYRRCGGARHRDNAAPAKVAVDAGMSLVEVLVAISIVTIGVLGLLAALVTDAKSQTLEKTQATAIHLADGALESARAEDWDTLIGQAGTTTLPQTVNGITYSERTTVEVCSASDSPNSCTTPDTTTPSTVHAGVVVTWNAGGKSHSVTMQRSFANQSSTTTGGTTNALGSCGGNGLTLVTGHLGLSPSLVSVNGSGATTAAVTVTLTQTGLAANNTSCIPLTWSDDNGAHQVAMTPSGNNYTYTIAAGAITKATSNNAGSVLLAATVPGMTTQPTTTLTIQGKPAFTTCSVQAVGLSLNTITLVPLSRNTLLSAGFSCTTTNLSASDSVTATYQTGTTTKTVNLTSTDGKTWTYTLPAGSAMVKTGSEGITFSLSRASDGQTANQSLSVTLL